MGTSLDDAIDLAFHVVRSWARAAGPDSVPRELRSLVGDSSLDSSGRAVVRRVLEVDDGMRARIAEQLSEAEVGAAGWKWLSAPGAAATLGVERDELRATVEALRADARRALERAKSAEAAASDAVARLGQSMQENERLRRRVTELDRRATSAETRLGELRKDIRPPAPVDAEVPAEPDPRPPPARPHRLGRGLFDDSPAGLRALLEVEGVRFFVDGYNVAMLGWPMSVLAEQRRRLVDTLDLWLSDPTRSRVVADVVFDGAGVGASGARSGTTRVRVSWSPAGVTADDVLVDRVSALDAVTVVVTDDLELRERVRAVGANVVGSRTLLTTVQ